MIQWNGSALSTQLLGSQLEAQVNAAQVAIPGDASITVFNPGFGGGISNAKPLQVLYQPAVVNQVTNDMVWDPVNQVFYLSIPGSASTNANDICVLNPTSGVISSCQPAGSNPDRLAISDDSQFLYVGEDGTGTVQRFILPALTPDIRYSLGNNYYALDIQVAPGNPHTTAISKGENLDPRAEGGIAIYDDATPRPTIAPGWNAPGGRTYDSLQWGPDASVLYASDTESVTNGYDFYVLSVNSSGVTLKQDYPAVFWNPGQIHFDKANGLIYSDDGFHAVNPSTGLPAGIFEVGGDAPMAPDSTLNTVFLLSKYAWQPNNVYNIELFDLAHYVLASQVPFYTQGNLSNVGRFIRWGSDGLALEDRAGYIYLISGSFVAAPSASMPVKATLSGGMRGSAASRLGAIFEGEGSSRKENDRVRALNGLPSSSA